MVKKPKKIGEKKSPCIKCSDCCSYCTVLCEKLTRYKARRFINQTCDDWEKWFKSKMEDIPPKYAKLINKHFWELF